MVWLLILLVLGIIGGNILLLKYSAKVGWPTPEQLKQRGIRAQPMNDKQLDAKPNAAKQASSDPKKEP